MFTHEYHLSSVLVHVGTTTFEGHYVTCTKQDNDTWLLHDDEKPTKQISLKDMENLAFGGQHGGSAYLLLYVCVDLYKESMNAQHGCGASCAAAVETSCETDSTCGLPNVHNEQISSASNHSRRRNISHVAPNIVSHRLHGHSGKRYNCRFTTQINQGNAALIKQCKSRRAIQQHIITSIVTRLRAEKITTRRITRGKNANIVSPPVRKTILKKAAKKKLPIKERATRTSLQRHHKHATIGTGNNGQSKNTQQNMAKGATKLGKNCNIVPPKKTKTKAVKELPKKQHATRASVRQRHEHADKITKQTGKQMHEKKKATRVSPRLHTKHATRAINSNEQHKGNHMLSDARTASVQKQKMKQAKASLHTQHSVTQKASRVKKTQEEHGAKTSFKQKKRTLSQQPKLPTKKKKANNGLATHKSAATKGTKGKRSFTQPKVCTKKKKTHTNSATEHMNGATVEEKRCCNYSLCVHV